MFEVTEPATQHGVDLFDRCLKRHAAGTPGLVADRVTQFQLALVPRPAPALVEPVAEEP
jgi:hypothetical protein